jgi:hypothetical protein
MALFEDSLTRLIIDNIFKYYNMLYQKVKLATSSLSPLANASLTGDGCAGVSGGPTARAWAG